MSLAEKLSEWVAAGGERIGEVSILKLDGGRFQLCHVADADAAVQGAELESHAGAIAAREIILYDDAGEYRPLKSAPSLRRGWRLELRDLAQLHEALDYFYPAALGTWIAQSENRLAVTPMRDTLGRQTGMYRNSNGISDQGAQELIAATCGCADGCLKRVCWPLESGVEVDSLPPGELGAGHEDASELPLLCAEVCNWFVAKARKVSIAEYNAKQEESNK